MAEMRNKHNKSGPRLEPGPRNPEQPWPVAEPALVIVPRGYLYFWTGYIEGP